jgi:hypothetical protein
MGEQAIARLRKLEVSWDDVRRLWPTTNGPLEERAEQLEQQIRNEIETGEGESQAGSLGR